MSPDTYVDPALTRPDLLVLQRLLHDNEIAEKGAGPIGGGKTQAEDEKHDSAIELAEKIPLDDGSTIETLNALNNPKHAEFEPTIFVLWDLKDINLPPFLNDYVLQPYIRWARRTVRVETDVVMLTHLILYFTTSVPSALYLFHNFTYPHAILHWIMQSYYVGTYNLMMHQHIHMRGILAKKYWLFDQAFPYLLDPLFGHTWNTYFFHHVKHHHVEGNGPDDLSSTIRYQRDDIWNLLHYIARFFFFIWFDLPLYFFGKGKYVTALKAGASETGTFALWYVLGSRVDFRATLFAIIIEFVLLRIGLMVGNWGQHAFVDEIEPDSDFRSSITLIDVASNRFCFNDGYHTSHHLNPLRHWRQHPVAFLKQKQQYADEHALVFRNIDYIFITVRLMMKDYMHLAKCLVPIGDEQRAMTMEERAAMLETKTRRFTEEEIRRKFKTG
ncbi:hypothetical protein K490DRAFT_76497 [Saccharata proteae CBS 121410]|uniref:Fatty acid desaturase domain-containing protein n=1 Tax=Saccharata proteae CBS 121410 TaxID=1314787 RepID=A0A9P4HQG3_9PEZI|nr:hypothetical protein K490DRAFT_76497 [Saccharata proteae CBS 121410]